MAGGGLAGAAQFSGSGAERDAARPLDDLPHPTPDRRGNPSGGVPLGAATLGGKGPAEGEDGGHRCHDLGGERSLALDCATGDGRGLSGVPQAAGAGIVVVQATSAMCSPAWGRVSRIVAVSPASPVATVTATTAPVSRSTACSAL